MILYAFEYNSCIFESGYSLQSLHITLKGARTAQRCFLNKQWQDTRHGQLMYGTGYKERSDPLQGTASRIKKIEVLP